MPNPDESLERQLDARLREALDAGPDAAERTVRRALAAAARPRRDAAARVPRSPAVALGAAAIVTTVAILALLARPPLPSSGRPAPITIRNAGGILTLETRSGRVWVVRRGAYPHSGARAPSALIIARGEKR
jgi:hypothetical protein